MKRWATLLFLLSASVAVADAPRISRNALAKLEGRLDAFLVKGPDSNPLLGNTRGLYLDGYGAVFTSMVMLAPTPVQSPFREITAKDVSDVHDTKLKHIAVVKDKMREMLLMMAADPALDSVRPDEQVIYGLTFFYYKQWENLAGLPAQIVMQGEKQKLLDVQSGRVPRARLDSIVKVQEL